MCRKRHSISSVSPHQDGPVSKFSESRLLYDGNNIHSPTNAALILENIKQEVDSIETYHFEGATTPARNQSAIKRRSSVDSRGGFSEADLGIDSVARFGSQSLKACKIEDDTLTDSGETTFGLFASLFDSAIQERMLKGGRCCYMRPYRMLVLRLGDWSFGLGGGEGLMPIRDLILRFEKSCRDVSESIRYGPNIWHRVVEDKLMRQKAQLLLDEAATWSLLWYLYGKGNQPLSSNTSLLEIDACDDQVFHNFYGLSSLLKFFGLNLECLLSGVTEEPPEELIVSPSTSHLEACQFVVNDHTAQLCLRILQWLEGLASKALDLESKKVVLDVMVWFWNIIGALGLISELMDICIQQTRLITLLEEIYMLKVANFTLFSTTDHACVLLEFGLNLSVLGKPGSAFKHHDVQGSHVGTYLPKSGIWHQTQRFLQKGASNTNTVQHLDFDAPTREHAHQLLDDKKQDESLLEDIWTLLRAGRLEKALDLCRSAGQPWRAATLCPFGGLDLVPSVEALVKNGKNRRLQAIELESGIGHQWHLWKWASYCASESSFVTISEIAEQNGGKYEVAVYAAQCSNLKRILPICTNWESACWAMSKSWLDARVDLELARSQPGRTVQLKSYGDVGDGSPGQIDGAAHAAGPENWPQQVLNQQPRNLSALLQKLHSGELVNEAVSRGCKEQHRQIEMDLMLGNIPHLLDMIWSWIAPSEDDQNIFRPHGDSQMIRFGAHLVLVLRYLHAEEMQDSFREKLMTVGDLILHMYVMFLFTKQHEELVGIYASQLARHRCIDLFVHMMELRLNSSVHVKYKIFLSAMEYLPFSSEDDSKGSFEEIIERSREVKGGKYDKSSDVAEQPGCRVLKKLHQSNGSALHHPPQLPT
ncbi:hypothetical protein POTOM_001358 [Populus tomentosa]|uniref:Nuclear pore complex protein n=1 Tax=Populus tomentosa TaxID=118781 RepID=A0A8X8DHS1_POPTO|nr:hypothetical protein POTOM_001358 [Populus tomentosa]